MSLIWRVNRDGELLSLERPVYSVDSVRGERALASTLDKRFKGIVRLASIDEQSQFQGVVSHGSIMVYTDFVLQEGDIVIWRTRRYIVDAIVPHTSIYKALCKEEKP